MELWRARPADVIVQPAFPGEVTVQDAGTGSRHRATRIARDRTGSMSGALDPGGCTGVRLLASEDGVNAVRLTPPVPGAGSTARSMTITARAACRARRPSCSPLEVRDA